MQTQERRGQEAVAALLPGLRAGSSQAWARLYDHLAPALQRYAASCLSGDMETAEELAVEALADAARGISRFDPQRSSLSAWIFGMARREVQIELRKESRRKSVPAWAQVSFEDLSELADSDDFGARTAARLDAQRRVEELRNLLSDSEIELLGLSAVEELPVREIGRAVGRSEQATQMLLHRARQKARRTAIEGTLVCGEIRTHWEAHRIPGGSAHCFTGGEDWRSRDGMGLCADLSPAGDEIVYFGPGPEGWTLTNDSLAIWKSRLDGSSAVNLSETAGLGGRNLNPTWSPDGTMIAFVREIAPATMSFRQGGGTAGGEIWVMKSDGSQAHMVWPEANTRHGSPTWCPDGSRLLWGLRHEGHWRTIVVNTSGRGTGPLPEVGCDAHLCPDGSKIASIRHSSGEADGERGQWNQLLLTRADGSRPKVLVEQFIADWEVEAHRHLEMARELDPWTDWDWDLRAWAGPTCPTWSPSGDKIAFLAAMPFDPAGLPFRLQVDAWVYDLVTKRLTKLTQGAAAECSLSWR